MVHATWGDWFVREELEAVEPTGLSVWYLGCNGFALRSAETTAYLDPYFGDGNPPRLLRLPAVPMDPADATLCDAVLVTHEHRDHMHPPSYEPLVELGADLHAPASCYEAPDCEVRTDEHSQRYRTVEPGDGLEIGDLTVHVREANDPDAVGEVSYVVEHEAGTFFHGGDSRPCEAFREVGAEFDIDVGVLALGSRGRRFYPSVGEPRDPEVYMPENDVIAAANALELDRLVPAHFRMWKGLEADPKILHEHASSYSHPRSVEVLGIGDRVDVEDPGVVPLSVLE